MAHSNDAELIQHKHNTARFFTENRHISWVLLICTVIWGLWAYVQMPKRKDPEVPVRVAVALCPWPGANAFKVEQQVTRKLEERISENSKIDKIESISRSSLSVVYVYLDDRVSETGKEFDDIKLKLDAIADLPPGAGPIRFVKDFGDTAALMLTVASPKAQPVELSIRARDIRNAIQQARSQARVPGHRLALVVCLPISIDPMGLSQTRDDLARDLESRGFLRDVHRVDGSGFFGADVATDITPEVLLREFQDYLENRLHTSEFHPDTWAPVVIRDLSEVEPKLNAVAGPRYSYRELDDLTDLIQRTLQAVPEVSKVTRSGVLPERIFLEYSQERLAAYGAQPARLSDVLSARNITGAGGVLEVQGKDIAIDPSGEFRSEKDIGDLMFAAGPGTPALHMRDLFSISRAYESPPRYLCFYVNRDANGKMQRSRAVTLAVQMKSGEQIDRFGVSVDAALASLKSRLPDDLILARTSDQPLQVHENIGLFMKSLYEAIGLVILVALIGFWEWRSALVMAVSIPITLMMTFGMIHTLGIDVQQVSIASLIIALGLLVDDPVVAGDAIKRDLAAGHPPIVAAWLGPTKLASAIMFATITNIVAYLPFLLLSGDTGRFLYSLPIVLTCSLIASRIASMTFIPLLGYHLLRAAKKPPPPIEERRKHGFSSFYYKLGGGMLNHRWLVLAGSFLFLGVGVYCQRLLKPQFFPKDLSYLSYVDVWLPEDAPLSATQQAARIAEDVIVKSAAEYGKDHPDEDGSHDILKSVTSFLGGGGPRFWFSVSPELVQLNYAQLVIQLNDKHQTEPFVRYLQRDLSAGVPGARVDVRQLESGKPVGVPVSVRISGYAMSDLRRLGEEAKAIFRSIPGTDRVRDDWGDESFEVKLEVDPDRANLAGVSNLDVAMSAAVGLNGQQVAVLREGDHQIPVLIRLRPEERARLSDIQNLYVHSANGAERLPLREVSLLEYGMQTEKVRRRNQFRTITVSAFPVPGKLPSEISAPLSEKLAAFQKTLPPGYKMEIGGELEEQLKGFKNLGGVMAVSVFAIFIALVLQFRNAVKPIVVFAAIPYGMVGAFAALAIMGVPFGFMAFLGIASLVGVIVSHVIVLFDFIEEKREEGEPLREALLDAGIIRLRPVMVTVGATVFGLIPLAMHGGPMWEPLCYSQIGGLLAATAVTLLLVPTIYAIFVLDLKLIRWEGPKEHAA